MAAILIPRSYNKLLLRFPTLISRNLHCSYKEIVDNYTFSLNAISYRKFHKMSAFSTSSEKSSSLDLSGIFPPIVTPFQENEDISYDKLTENFNKWEDVPFRGEMINMQFLWSASYCRYKIYISYQLYHWNFQSDCFFNLPFATLNRTYDRSMINSWIGEQKETVLLIL